MAPLDNARTLIRQFKTELRSKAEAATLKGQRFSDTTMKYLTRCDQTPTLGEPEIGVMVPDYEKIFARARDMTHNKIESSSVMMDGYRFTVRISTEPNRNGAVTCIETSIRMRSETYERQRSPPIPNNHQPIRSFNPTDISNIAELPG
jgi:hypothetical protein